MKIVLELALLFAISLFSEFLSSLVPFPLPSSVIALVIMLILLTTKILKEKHIQPVGDFLLSNISFFYIPPTVSILNHLDIIRSAWWKIAVISVASYFIVFASALYSVRLTQKIINLIKGRRRKAIE